MINKKGQGVMGIIFFFIIIFTILIIGFIASFAVGIIGYTSDEISPVMKGIGMVEDLNVSTTTDYTFDVIDTFADALPWLTGFAYVGALVFCIVFAVSFRVNPSPVFMGLFFMLMLLIVMGAIIMSNMYEEMYTAGDEISLQIQNEQPLMAFMILHSPVVITVMGFIAGIYMFAGRQESEGGI